MPTRKTTVDMPQLVQASRIGSVDEASRTVEVVFSTGARIQHMMRTPDGAQRVMTQVVVDEAAADLSELNSGAPVLRDHNAWSVGDVIGCVERAWIEDGAAKAVLRISAAADVANDWTRIAEGTAVQWSMGFDISEVTVVPDPEREGEDLWLLSKWKPVEISLVPIGADSGAKTQAADAPSCPANIVYHAQEGDMPDAKKQAAAPSEAPETKTQAAKPAPAAPAIDKDDIARQAVEAERLRHSAIKGAAKRLNAPEDLVEEALTQGVTVDDFRIRAVEAHVAQGQSATRGLGGMNASVTADATERFRQGAELGLLSRTGMGGERNEFTGMTLREIARQSLAVAGAGMAFTDPREMIGAAFVQSGAHGTSDFANVLSSIMGKAALKGWDEAEETFHLWTSVGTLTDFKPTKRVGLGNFNDLALIDEGGEYTSGTVGDRGETVTLATYGKEVRITRQAIINDDLQLLSGIPRKMGRAAKRTIGNLVYAVLTSNPTMADGTALFHADHKNLLGSGTALSVASLSAMEAAMMTQTEETGAASKGRALNISPAYLLVPPSLKRTAINFMTSQTDPTASKGHANNPVAGMAEVIADGRLTGTAWYGAANPSMHDGVEVSYLNGQQEPYLEEAESWSTDGVKMKVRMDAAAAPLDHRTFYKNPGA